MSRILVVYNICGVKRDNTYHYPAFLQSIENQTFDGEVVVGNGGSGDWGDECYTSYNCDVVGSFRRGICDDPWYQNSQVAAGARHGPCWPYQHWQS